MGVYEIITNAFKKRQWRERVGVEPTYLLCIDKLVLKTSRATGPYPLPSDTYRAITCVILLIFANDDDCLFGR